MIVFQGIGISFKQVAQRGFGCPAPGSVQDQAGWGLSNLVWWKKSLFMAGELKLGDL